MVNYCASAELHLLLFNMVTYLLVLYRRHVNDVLLIYTLCITSAVIIFSTFSLLQTTALNACHRRFGAHAEHFAFLDVDEFMYIGAGRRLSDIIPEGKKCGLLANTWGVAVDLALPLTFQSLLNAKITTLGPLVKLKGDPHALYRHKLYAHVSALVTAPVGVHGFIEPLDLQDHQQPAPDGRCMFTWKPEGTDSALDTSIAGYLHILSPLLKSARPRADTDLLLGRNAGSIEQEIRKSEQRYFTDVLSTSVQINVTSTSGTGYRSTSSSASFATRLPFGLLRPGNDPSQDYVFGDLVIGDAFLRGSCVTVLIAQHKDKEHQHDLSKLQLEAVVDAKPMRIPTAHRVSIWPGQDQGAAYVKACSPLLESQPSLTLKVSYQFSPSYDSNSLRSGFIAVPRVYEPHRQADVGLCTLFKGTSPSHLLMWLQYHYALGVATAYLYHHGQWEELLAHGDDESMVALQDFVASGKLTFIQFETLPYSFPASSVSRGNSHVAQSLAHNSCNLRMRSLARQTMFIDTDEFVYVHRNYSLATVLDYAGSPSPETSSNSRPGSRDCLLMASTWAILDAITDRPSLEWLLNSEIRAAQPLVNYLHDHNAPYRHKVLIRSNYSELVGIHGVYRPSDSPCVVRYGVNGTTADPELIGFLHIISPTLVSATTAFNKALGTNRERLRQEVLARESTQPTRLHRESLADVRGYCRRDCVADMPLSPQQQQGSEVLNRQWLVTPFNSYQGKGYFRAEELAYGRCEAAPACPIPTAAPIAVAGPREAIDPKVALGVLQPYEGMPPPPPMPEDLPPGTRLIVQGEAKRGRYSNMRHGLLDMSQLGLITNRAVVTAPMGFSTDQCRESLDELYDWDHLNKLVRIVAAPALTSGIPRQRLVEHCAPNGLHAAPEDAPVMLVNLERHFKYSPQSTTLMPSWGQYKVAGGVAWEEMKYGSIRGYYLERWPLVNALTGPLANRTCVGLSAAFWALPFFHPDKTKMHNQLRPSAAVQATIDDIIERAIGGTQFVGLHMRLTDIGFSNGTFCQRNLTATFGLVHELLAGQRLDKVVLATDDFESYCAKAFFTEFPAAIPLRSGAYDPGSCSEAQVVQEVLARGACFIGSKNSTFSAAIEDLRMTERVHNRNPPPCTFNEAAGQMKFWR